VLKRAPLLLVVLLLLLPLGAAGFVLTTRRPERDDERWFERVVRRRAFELQTLLRASPLRPVVNLFSRPPTPSCIVTTRVAAPPPPPSVPVK